MVSMGFLEPSTGRAALWRAEGSAIQFTGEENCGGFCVHLTCPHEFTVQESLWKACPRTFSSSLPRPPSGEEGRGRQRPQFSASSPSTTQRPPKEKEREGYCCLLWTMERERERERLRKGMPDAAEVVESEV